MSRICKAGLYRKALGIAQKYKLPEKMVQAAENKDLLMTQVVLTIGGSDSGGGAGIQADLKTFCVLGLHGTCAVTAVTAQNTLGVQQVYGQGPDVVTAQLISITDDFFISFAKTGMLPSS